MQFTRKLRERIRNGEITTSIRIWRQARVRAGGRYRLEDGWVVVDSIREIGFDDISDSLARESGFAGLADLLKTARHGAGQRVWFVRFHFEAGEG